MQRENYTEYRAMDKAPRWGASQADEGGSFSMACASLGGCGEAGGVVDTQSESARQS